MIVQVHPVLASEALNVWCTESCDKLESNPTVSCAQQTSGMLAHFVLVCKHKKWNQIFPGAPEYLNGLRYREEPEDAVLRIRQNKTWGDINSRPHSVRVSSLSVIKRKRKPRNCGNIYFTGS